MQFLKSHIRKLGAYVVENKIKYQSAHSYNIIVLLTKSDAKSKSGVQCLTYLKQVKNVNQQFL